MLLRVVRKLREDLSFSEEEFTALKIDQKPDTITWDAAADKGKDIDVGPQAAKYIARCLKSASDANRLTEDLLRVWDVIVPEEQHEDTAATDRPVSGI